MSTLPACSESGVTEQVSACVFDGCPAPVAVQVQRQPGFCI